jgi:F-type H+-transporting ATPase subunit delta
MRGSKQIQQQARAFLRLSVVDGRVSEERVAGVLAYVEKHGIPHAPQVLNAYRHLLSLEIARGRAVVEHAGPVADAALTAIGEAMSRRYARPVTAIAKPAPGLLAGLRVRVGDDVYESSASGQLAALAASR